MLSNTQVVRAVGFGPVTKQLSFYQSAFMRHDLHNDVILYMLQIGKNTSSRIAVTWVVIMEGLAYRMPEDVIKASLCLTETIIECKEFKLHQSSKYDLSTHSNVKNTHNERDLAGISPNGIGLIFREIYPGSIFDGNIDEKPDFISWFSEIEVVTNFDIIGTFIHIEKFIGSIRN